MNGKKSVRVGAAILACVLALSSSGLQVLGADNRIVPVRSTSQTQMQSELETVYVNAVTNSAERRQNFDDNWKFNLGDVRAAEAKEFDDSKWETVSVPHDYSIIQEYQQNLEAESGYLPGGVGWYRKYFTVSSDMLEKSFRIDFDGVYMNATVYVNGHELGKHPFGYTPFSFDITDYVKAGQENVIAVKVDHKTPSSRWYSGSGIYRSVYLNVMNKVHVGLYGQKIETPSLEEQMGGNVTMNVNTTVANDSDAAAEVILKHTVLKKGDESNLIAEYETPATSIAAGESQKIEASFDTTSTPALWSDKDPSLYTVRTEVKVGEHILDKIEEEYGFRYFKMEKDTGAYLNGNPIKLKGVCMHHDQGSLGAAAYRRAIERQVEILKEMGANSIRVTHNPAAEVLIDICNEKGMLVIDELFDGWKYAKNGNKHDYSEWFDQPIGANNAIIGGSEAMKWAEFDLRATLQRGQNDPSIIMWSLGNEIQEGASDSGYEQVAANLIQWAKDTDNTRMLTIGSNAVKRNANTHINIANQLTSVGGSSGTNYSNGTSYDQLHSKYPDWKLYGSETASSVNSRGVYTTKRNGGSVNNPTGLDENKQLTSYDKSAVSWGAFASAAWYDVIQRDFVAGEYVWTGFDYIGEPTPANGVDGGPKGVWPSPKNSYFGIVDTAGFQKDSYYFYQSQWNDDVKTLHILPTWNEETVVTEGTQKKVEVVVYSDAPKVTLYLDPADGSTTKEIGTLEMEEVRSGSNNQGLYTYQKVKNQTGHTSLYRTFEVPFEAGTLRAVAKDENDNLITDTKGRSSVTTAGAATKLVATADRTALTADGHDLTYIEVDVKDANDNIVPNAKERVTFKVEGDGELVGVDNGSSPDHDSYKADNRCAHAGKVLAIVKSTKKAGKFTVTASADGLQESQVSVTTTEAAGTPAERQIVSYRVPRNFYVKKGNVPTLPTTVEISYSNETKEHKQVVWDPIADEQLNGDATFQVNGKVDNGDIALPVVVNVSMISNVAAVMNYSTTVSVGTEKLNLPAMRPAILEDGTVLNASFDVAWDPIPENAFATAGEVVVKGTANVFGQPEKVQATIRVQEEEIKIGDNIAPQAKLEQDIEEAKQSDTLTAITDGIVEYKTVTEGTNPNVWSNYANSQAGDNRAEISFVYATQQRFGEIEVTFFRDNWSARFPDPNSVQFYLDGDKTHLEATEIIPEDKPDSGVAICTYTYKFAPVSATEIYMDITNSATQQAQSPQITKVCTGITEVVIKEAVGSFNTNTTAELASLTLNGKEIPAEQLAKGYVDTPALVAKLENVAAKDNASVTVLPEYNNVVKLIIESEDHKTTKTFEIRLDSSTITPDDASRDVPYEDSWTILAESEQIPNNSKENIKDGDLNTLWHTKWGQTAPEDQRHIGYAFPEVKTLDGLRYYPRIGNGGDKNGRVTKYRVEYRETDNGDWQTVQLVGENGQPVTEGTWPLDTTDWLATTFYRPIQTKEIRLVGVETFGDGNQGNKFMSCVELRVTAPKQGTDLSGYTAELDSEMVIDGVIELPYLEEGQEVCPVVTVTDEDGTPLEWGIDYKVIYVNNTSFNEEAKAIVEGILNYSGTIEIPFAIRQTPKTLTSIFANEGYTNVYTEGDYFNPEGLTLRRVYSDHTEDTVTYNNENALEFAFEPGLDVALKETDRKVKTTYGGYSIDLDITVNKEPVDPDKPVDPDQPTKPDYKELKALLDEIAKLDSKNYTKESWNVLQSEVDAANTLIESGKATPEEIKAAYDQLSAAYKALKEKQEDQSKPAKPNKPANQDKPTNPNKPADTDKQPQTGDTTNLLMMIVCMLAAVGCAGVVVRMRKKH